MNRLSDKTVFSGFVMAWRFATWPTRISPSFVKATTEGVSRLPSWLGMTMGLPPSITATTELVVPRSMPITLGMRSSVGARTCRGSGRGRESCLDKAPHVLQRIPHRSCVHRDSLPLLLRIRWDLLGSTPVESDRSRPYPRRRLDATRAMIRAHLRRWRPRPHAQRTGSTPRVRPSGAALQLDPSHRSSQRVSPTAYQGAGARATPAFRHRYLTADSELWREQLVGVG